MNLRKHKAALIKLNILNSSLKIIGRKSFDELFVDQICAKVKISKVTLFSYFPTKEHLLLYYYRIWCLQRAIELQQKPYEGVSGIYYLFDRWSESYEEYPGIVLGVCSQLSKNRRRAKPFPVSREEKKIVYNNNNGHSSYLSTDVSLIFIQPVEMMIEKFTLEAIMHNEISKTSSTSDLSGLFCSVFFGSALTAYLSNHSVSKLYFRNNIDFILKNL